MIKCKCIDKWKDKSGNVVEYLLVDTKNTKITMDAKGLKSCIRDNILNVVNLTLTKDNRLVEKEEKVKKMPVVKIEAKEEPMARIHIEKALNNALFQLCDNGNYMNKINTGWHKKIGSISPDISCYDFYKENEEIHYYITINDKYINITDMYDEDDNIVCLPLNKFASLWREKNMSNNSIKLASFFKNVCK